MPLASVHPPSLTRRLSDNELLQFEATLEATEAAIFTDLRARTPVCLSATDATHTLRAVVDTIAALTDTMPPTLESKRALVHWVATSIIQMRDKPSYMNAPMNPEAVRESLALIGKLNRVLGGPAS